MKSRRETLKDIADLELNANKIRSKAANRELRPDEKEVLAEIDEYVGELKMLCPEAAMTVMGPQNISMNRNTPQAVNRGLRGPGDAKDYQSLFGAGGHRWEDKDISFFAAALGGRYHPQLVKNAMSETVPSDGGFLVPTQYAKEIQNVSLENEIVLPWARVQPMTSNEIRLPAMSIGNHSQALLGGFEASYTSEGGTINENSPKVRQMTLFAKKLTGLIRFSAELAADAIGGESQIIQLCGRGLSWYRDRAFLKGTGAGQPQGLMNSPALITVDAEVGQDADTIVYENLTKMMGRMFSGSFGNSTWVAHQSTIPQLLGLSIQTGISGQHYPAMTESNGQYKLLTRPVVFTEKTEPLGTKGDLMLVDFSQYIIGLRGSMRLDVSIHTNFSNDEILARLIERHDGQSLWDQTVTLEDGVNSVSPFVCLGER